MRAARPSRPRASPRRDCLAAWPDLFKSRGRQAALGRAAAAAVETSARDLSGAAGARQRRRRPRDPRRRAMRERFTTEMKEAMKAGDKRKLGDRPPDPGRAQGQGHRGARRRQGPGHGRGDPRPAAEDDQAAPGIDRDLRPERPPRARAAGARGGRGHRLASCRSRWTRPRPAPPSRPPSPRPAPPP